MALLQKVVAESRKSRRLRQWLLLVTRLGVLAAFILAFAQPFSASKAASQEQETVLYLDTSFSMQAEHKGRSLLENAVQNLIKHLDPDRSFSLFTNEKAYKNTSLKALQNTLLSLPFSHEVLRLEDIVLKANSLFTSASTTPKKLLLISDFQKNMGTLPYAPDTTISVYAVPVRPNNPQNVAIDSVSITSSAILYVWLSGGTPGESLPLSLYQGDTLIAKTAASFTAERTSEVAFSLPAQQEINGRLQITDQGLHYDNQFFFTVDPPQKIKVLAISASSGKYLERLYPEEDFIFRKYALPQLEYSALEQQHVVVLDHLTAIPIPLQKELHAFAKHGGTLIVIPAAESDLASYNAFFSRMGDTRFTTPVVEEKQITTIAFQHPLYADVFTKEVTQFSYPQVQRYFKVRSSASKILTLEGGDAFLLGQNGLYCFTAPLNTENSNFTNAPLIVPSFYAMALTGLIPPERYHTVGKHSTVDIPVTSGQDQIVTIAKEDHGWIPLQQRFPHKLRLTFDQNPSVDGTFSITQAGEVLQHISFNYPRTESSLQYVDLEALEGVTVQDSIRSLFESLKAESQNTTYWQGFIILGLLLALAEVIIQKYAP